MNQLPDTTDDQREAPAGPFALVRSVYFDRFGLVATLTLLVTAMAPPRGAGALTLAAAIALLAAMAWVGRTAWAWALLTFVVIVDMAPHPILDLDNHHFLHIYWLAAVTLSRLAKSPGPTLATSARWLVGLVFLFATVWKLLTPDFADGSFLAGLMVLDYNLTPVAVALDWQDADAATTNRESLRALETGPDLDTSPRELHIGEPVHTLAPLLSRITVLLEGAVAVAFLSPLRGRWRLLRELTLFTFLLVTYPLLPVLSFAGLLAAMGLASSSLTAPWRQVNYLGALVVIRLASVLLAHSVS